MRYIIRKVQDTTVFVLMGWSLLPNALRPFFKDLLCSLELGYYDVNMTNFAQRSVFSGLRFFNEPEISDSGSRA